ncbi:MAG: hypothetical protein ACP5UA_06935 [Candidatus Hydrogenedens sp.]
MSPRPQLFISLGAFSKSNYDAEFHFWWPAHNLGRWLDAMLRLESATGFKIPHKLESACINNLHRFLIILTTFVSIRTPMIILDSIYFGKICLPFMH